jgi:hypothetical protein
LEQIAVKEERARLAMSANVNASGEFEVLAISAGEGNGWQFSPESLRGSLPLWEGVETFVDHTPEPRLGHSLRDLAGICREPRYDEERKGVVVRLRPSGPSAALLQELGRQWLEEPAPRPRVGFSADLVFTAKEKRVERILRVLSLDAVFNPARGGSFLRALNANKEVLMSDAVLETVSTPAAPGEAEQGAAAELQKAREARAQMCACLLDASLGSARLPAPLAERVRARFGGGAFEPRDLQAAIEDARKLAGELTAPGAIRGAAAPLSMYDAKDQLSAALHDLLGAPRPEGLEGLKTARLSGIREFYTLTTGDTDFAGGYHAERARFAVTSDLPGVLKNALNKLILAQWQELGRAGYRWWEALVSVEHFNSLQDITGVLVGEITVLPAVSEGAAYTSLAISDSAEVGAWGKYGGYVGLTLEMFERDETHKLRQYPKKLASAALRRISALVGAVFTGSSGTGPAMADTYHVFESAHHGNLGTTALSSAAWEAAGKAIYSQPMLVGSGGTAPKLALDAKYLVVPRDLRLTAMRLLYPSFEREATIFSENLQRGEMGDVITCPEFTDANDWAAVADPRVAPGIILGERFGLLPEIFIADGELTGALFTNDELRMKVRHWVSVFVADYRPLYKANVP